MQIVSLESQATDLEAILKCRIKFRHNLTNILFMIGRILILLYEGGEIIKLKKNFVQYIRQINLRITKVQTYFLIKKRERLLIPWQQRYTHWCIWLFLKISKRGKLIQIRYYFFFQFVTFETMEIMSFGSVGIYLAI